MSYAIAKSSLFVSGAGNKEATIIPTLNDGNKVDALGNVFNKNNFNHLTPQQQEALKIIEEKAALSGKLGIHLNKEALEKAEAEKSGGEHAETKDPLKKVGEAVWGQKNDEVHKNSAAGRMQAGIWGEQENTNLNPSSGDALQGNAMTSSAQAQEEQKSNGNRAQLAAAGLQLTRHNPGDDKMPEVTAHLETVVAEDIAAGKSVSTFRLQSDMATLAAMTGVSLGAMGITAEEMPRTEYIGMGFHPDAVISETRGAHDAARGKMSERNEQFQQTMLPPLSQNT